MLSEAQYSAAARMKARKVQRPSFSGTAARIAELETHDLCVFTPKLQKQLTDRWLCTNYSYRLPYLHFFGPAPSNFLPWAHGAGGLAYATN